MTKESELVRKENCEIQLKILEKLREEYEQNAFSYVSANDLVNFLEVDENIVKNNIKQLSDAGYIDTQFYLGGTFITKINNFGIDKLEKEKKEKDNNYWVLYEISEDPIIFKLLQTIKAYIEQNLIDISPRTLKKLSLLYNDIMDLNDSVNEQYFSRVAYTCREIINDFTDDIFKPEFIPIGEKPPARNQTKNKLRYTLSFIKASKTSRSLIESRLDYLLKYFDDINDLIQKNVHPEDFDITFDDAKACIINTMLLVWDTIRLLNAKEIE
ncbi:MAG: hypothetical protein WC796_03655 [Candidatus Pacearchaeota archaeon]|jgi:hypothetical protein